MNRDEFSAEMHEYLDNLYSDFQKCQGIIFDLFTVFDQICRNNEIKYFMAYGSLLGLIRDKGPIPWDYDIDTCVPFYLIDKLIDCLDSQLPADYYYITNYNSNSFPYYQMRICNKQYDSNYIHLDVFYLIGVPGDGRKAKRFVNKVQKLYFMREAAVIANNQKVRNNKQFARKIYYRCKSCFLPRVLIDCFFDLMAKKYKYDNSCFVNDIASPLLFKKSVLEPFKEMNVNGIRFFSPADEVSYFNQCYSNYKEYLPISNRFDEFYSFMMRYNSARKKHNNIKYTAY